jgi:ATP-dependent DNA ligase
MLVPMQKAKHLYLEQEKKKPNLNFTGMVSIKYDGWFIYFDYHKDEWTGPYTSSGRLCPALRWLLPQVKLKFKPKPGTNWRLIAEGIIPDYDFYYINGKFNTSQNAYLEDRAVLYFHDLVQFDALLRPTKDTAIHRYSRLVETLDDIKNPYFQLLPIEVVSSDIKVWENRAEKAWENNQEGVVIKKVDSLYLPGERSSELSKIKLEAEFDLECIKFYKTIGEKGNENWNMDLIDKYSTIVPIRIGKHTDIDYFQNHNPIGQVVSIKCMKKNKDGSYREPRFKCLRPDKHLSQID